MKLRVLLNLTSLKKIEIYLSKEKEKTPNYTQVVIQNRYPRFSEGKQ